MKAIAGFQIKPARAWWISCELCDEMDIVVGSTAEADAQRWAADHMAEAHGDAS